MVKSISFPEMFGSGRIQTIEDHNATLQNIKLVLGSEKGEFKFDPYFGVRLKRYMFEQNNAALQDLLKDEIYEQLVFFIPQITVSRNDITFQRDKTKLYITIKCINRLDFTPDTYSLVLYDNQQ